MMPSRARPRAVRVTVLHRQRLVAEATAAALHVLEPDLPVEVTTDPQDGQDALDDHRVLLADGALLPDGLTRRNHGASRALAIALGSADLVDETTQAVSALRAGASGWLPADASPEQLLHVIKVVGGGDMWVPAELLGPIVRRLIAPPSSEVEDLDLSPRERTVLDLLALGLTNREIAEQLQISTNTIRTHRQRLFRKIGAHSALEAAAWLRGAREDRAAVPALRSDGP